MFVTLIFKCDFNLILTFNNSVLSSYNLEFFVKSGKHNTRTLSLVQNRSRLLKKRTCKKVHWRYLYCCCRIYFHCSYLYDYDNYLEPCTLNAEFQHFISRFNKSCFLCGGPHSKRGIGGERRPKERMKTRRL